MGVPPGNILGAHHYVEEAVLAGQREGEVSVGVRRGSAPCDIVAAARPLVEGDHTTGDTLGFLRTNLTAEGGSVVV